MTAARENGKRARQQSEQERIDDQLGSDGHTQLVTGIAIAGTDALPQFDVMSILGTGIFGLPPLIWTIYFFPGNRFTSR